MPCSYSPRAAVDAIVIGGDATRYESGPDLALSHLVAENTPAITMIANAAPSVRHDRWRTGDQRWYVSDPRRFAEATGWRRNAARGHSRRWLGGLRWIARLGRADGSRRAARGRTQSAPGTDRRH